MVVVVVEDFAGSWIRGLLYFLTGRFNHVVADCWMPKNVSCSHFSSMSISLDGS